MSKIPNFWQFFNLSSDPTIPTLYWDAYSYEERLKKICDKIWAILRYLKLVMELLNEFDDRLTALEELYNALEARVKALEDKIAAIEAILQDHEDRISELERIIAELDLENIAENIDALFKMIAHNYDNTQTYTVGKYVIFGRKLWRCTTAVESAENFDPNKWTEVCVGDELENLRGRLDIIENVIQNIGAILQVVAEPYNEHSTYDIGDYVIYNNGLYRCTVNISSAETWNASHWTQVLIMDELIRLYNLLDTRLETVEEKITTLESWKTNTVDPALGTILSLHEYNDAASAKTASAATGHEYWICYVPESTT